MAGEKASNLPLRKVERAGCLYLATGVRGIVSSRVLKIAISQGQRSLVDYSP